MPRDLGDRAQDFREKWLAPSGGWLAEIVILLSDTTGIWDIIILSGIFVGTWIILRTSPMEIALILGFGFDLVIPLQYYNSEYFSSRHKDHLQDYWPTFMMGCIVEGVSFFLLHPDLFTLIVCIKTTFCLFMWLSKDKHGLALKSRTPRADRSGNNSEHPARSHRSSGRSGGNESSDDSDSSRPPRDSSGQGSNAASSNMPQSKYVKDPYKYLKRAGYKDPAIAGMILTMNQADKERAKKMFNGWRKEKDPKDIARRNKEYAERAKKSGWKPSSSSSSTEQTSDPATQVRQQTSQLNDDGPSNMPTSYHIPTSKAYKELKKAGYEDQAIAGMMIGMNMSDYSQAMNNYKIWTSEKDPAQIKRRNESHGNTSKKGGYPDKFKMNQYVGGPPSERLKKKLGIPVGSVKKVENLLNSKQYSEKNVPKELKKKIIDVLKNPKDENEITKVINTLKSFGIDVQGQPEFRDGFGSSDGKGGYRDIVLKNDDRTALIKSMVSKRIYTNEQVNQWSNYLKQPLSRNELEEKVIPFAKKIDCYLGEGYHGTGPHRFDPKKLENIKEAIKDTCHVSASMLDHMILKAINQKDPKKAQDMLNNWATNGMSHQEFEQYRKEIDWA
ncbi:uncharacterized protein L201_001727 [Kwoniella dendrophila CBS 6074]|uniref:Uncharacterized protein n=1 Tax=Kwoniella dendrophila CBS 6074 TaxID=1295534 RepID=A0AAX4JQT0_9TREE